MTFQTREGSQFSTLNHNDDFRVYINSFQESDYYNDQEFSLRYNYTPDELDADGSNPHNYSGVLINAGSEDVNHDGLFIPAFTSIAPADHLTPDPLPSVK